MTDVLAQLSGPTVTDGGMETDLIFHSGVDLPAFAAFPLLTDGEGRRLLTDYYRGYADIAERAGAGLLLESPTWRANPDWGAQLGYDGEALRRVNVAAIEFLHDLRRQATARRGAVDGAGVVTVGGVVGPRGDGYAVGAAVDPDAAADYHRPQLAAFAEAGADCATAYTLTDPGEAVGIVRAARSVGLPIAVSFTVETDGRLPGGTSLGTAIDGVDAAAPPDYYLVNCAHPRHLEPALDGLGGRRDRIRGLRCNASTQSHAELDEATELDDGDPAGFGAEHRSARRALPDLTILGGCCGTDARHVASLWGVEL